MKTTLRHRELFNCAHQVTGDPVCGQYQHGHDWFAEIVLVGGPDPSTGSIVTNAPALLAASVAELDGKDAAKMLPGAYTTPEGIAMWLMERLRLECPGLQAVTVGFTGHAVTVEV